MKQGLCPQQRIEGRGLGRCQLLVRAQGEGTLFVQRIIFGLAAQELAPDLPDSLVDSLDDVGLVGRDTCIGQDLLHRRAGVPRGLDPSFMDRLMLGKCYLRSKGSVFGRSGEVQRVKPTGAHEFNSLRPELRSAGFTDRFAHRFVTSCSRRNS